MIYRLMIMAIPVALGFQDQRRTMIPPLKVNFPAASMQDVQTDPARVDRDIDVSMALALHSPLLELTAESQLASGWADDFDWDGERTLNLHIRSDARLSDGSALTAEDVVFSLKRLALIQQGANSFFAEQFCWTHHLDSLASACPGLVAKGDRVLITTQDRIALLPQILTTAETAIVPQNSALSSGPYRADFSQAVPRLLANTQHYNYQPLMPQDIHLICEEESSVAGVVQAFHEHRIDHVVTFSTFNGFEFEKLREQIGSDATLHQTLPMGVATLRFTDRGRERFGLEERRVLVTMLQDKTQSCLKNLGQESIRQPTRVLIPATGAGALNAEEEQQYLLMQRSLPTPTWPTRARIALPNYINRFLGPCLSDTFTIASENADLQFSSYDISTYQELASIRSMIEESLLDVGTQTPTAWLQAYAREIDSEIRLDLLKNAHFRALWEDPRVIPLWNFRTNALVRRPWSMKFSSLSITNPFHLMRYER